MKFRPGETVRYGQSGLCRIEEVKRMKIGEKEQEYFVLSPLFKTGSVLYVPCDNEDLVARMCAPLTVEEVKTVLKEVVEREPEWIRDFRRRSEISKKALSSPDRRDALLLIKNIYFHKKEMLGEGKRIHNTDDYFLKDAESLIFNEFSYVLNLDYLEVIRFVRKELGMD